jgi:hypothetical protein
METGHIIAIVVVVLLVLFAIFMQIYEKRCTSAPGELTIVVKDCKFAELLCETTNNNFAFHCIDENNNRDFICKAVYVPKQKFTCRINDCTDNTKCFATFNDSEPKKLTIVNGLASFSAS